MKSYSWSILHDFELVEIITVPWDFVVTFQEKCVSQLGMEALGEREDYQLKVGQGYIERLHLK